MKEVILIKEGEIFLKGLNKKNFEAILISNIKKKLKQFGEFKIFKQQSTITVIGSHNFEIDLAINEIKKIFGIASFSKAVIAEKNFEDVKKITKKYLSSILKDSNTFKVAAKRSDKRFFMSSPKICYKIGEFLLEEFKNLKVELNKPEIVVNIEVRDDYVYIYSLKHDGAKGFPVGSNGEAMLLLSGGIDSPVAGWMMNKRGLKLKAIHFISPPYTASLALKKVHDVISKLEQWGDTIPLYVANITKLQEEIKKNCPENILTIILRRAMIRIAQKLALKESLNNSKSTALITGESLAQVASQTLAAINCTDSVSKIPILRPLIGLDKEEIVKIAKKINTFNISILPYEDCCTVFTPKHPKTNPKIFEIEKAEQNLDLNCFITAIVNNIEKH